MIAVAALIACITVASAQTAPTCNDADGNAQDFWVALKLPKRSASTNAVVANGSAHVYITSAQLGGASGASPATRTQFQFASLALNHPNSLLGRTLRPMYAAGTAQSASSRTTGDVFYFVFNDDTPTTTSSYYAHAKSIVVFNEYGGFILVHSIPNFPDLASSFSLPSSGLQYGQSLMCLTLPVAALETLARGYQLYNPQIYASSYSSTGASPLPSALSALYPSMAALLSGTRQTAVGANSSSALTTAGGASFTHFAKNAKWARDLYGDLVAPALASSLWVETWMRPFEASLYPPAVKFECINVKLISEPASGESWQESQDHSKWAISIFPSRAFVCVGDINKQLSQANRGGGTYCIRHANLHRVFASILVTNASVNEPYTAPSGADAVYFNVYVPPSSCFLVLPSAIGYAFLAALLLIM